MTEPISQAAQDYLKVIYALLERDGRATTSQIAAQLDITPASVTGMLQKMSQAEPPLLDYKKHQGVTLTAVGEKAALKVVRHHRLLELFLYEMLGYAWDEVHAEAERLEHAISAVMEERIAAALGHPRRDPHGQPIPTRDLEMLAVTDVPLSALRAGQTAVIRRVHDDNPKLLRYLDELGLRLQTRLRVHDYVAFDQNLHLQIAGRPETIVLGPQVTNHIFVELLTATTTGPADPGADGA